MYCSICGAEIESIDDAIDAGWLPSFWDGENEQEVCCPSCSEIMIQVGEDGEYEVKPEYRGKIVYAETENKNQHWVMGIAVRTGSQFQDN